MIFDGVYLMFRKCTEGIWNGSSRSDGSSPYF